MGFLIDSFKFGGGGNPELLPQDNAAAASDDNSLGSFTAERTSDVTVVTDPSSGGGTYAIKVVYDSQTFAGAFVELTGLENGGSYTMTADCKANVVDQQQMLLDDVNGWTSDVTTAITGTSYAEYNITGTTNSTTAKFHFQANTNVETAGRSITFDNVRIVKN